MENQVPTLTSVYQIVSFLPHFLKSFHIWGWRQMWQEVRCHDHKAGLGNSRHTQPPSSGPLPPINCGQSKRKCEIPPLSCFTLESEEHRMMVFNGEVYSTRIICFFCFRCVWVKRGWYIDSGLHSASINICPHIPILHSTHNQNNWCANYPGQIILGSWKQEAMLRGHVGLRDAKLFYGSPGEAG